MIKLFTTTQPFLLPRHIVWFSGSFPRDFSEKYFSVKFTKHVPRRLSYTLAREQTYDIDLSYEDREALYPELPLSLYEMHVGLEAENTLLYPMIPAGRYYLRLEATKARPTIDEPSFRYLGEYDRDDMPFKEGRLRIHLVKDVTPMIFRLYNDDIAEEKARLRFIVNRCKLVLIPEPTEDVKKIAREIWHPEDIRW